MNGNTIRTILAADTDGVAAIVADRVHWQAAPDDPARPYVVVKLTGSGGPVVDGRTPGDCYHGIAEIACCADGPQAAADLAAAVLACLCPATGTPPAGIAGAWVLSMDEISDVDPAGTLFANVGLYEVVAGIVVDDET
jgi:hypothetical protein